MSLATVLHDVAPTQLRGLTFLALSESGQVLQRTSADSRGSWTGGGTWAGTAYSPTAGSWSDTTGTRLPDGSYSTTGTGGGSGWKAGVWTAGTATGTTGSVYSGAQRETFTAGSVIPCRVDPMGGSEGQTANRLDERTTHRITVPPQTVVSAKDRFSSTAGTYEITAVRKRTDGQVLVLEACEDF